MRAGKSAISTSINLLIVSISAARTMPCSPSKFKEAILRKSNSFSRGRTGTRLGWQINFPYFIFEPNAFVFQLFISFS